MFVTKLICLISSLATLRAGQHHQRHHHQLVVVAIAIIIIFVRNEEK